MGEELPLRGLCGCGSEVAFVDTVDGKPFPIDPDPAGELVIDHRDGGDVVVPVRAAEGTYSSDRWRSHFLSHLVDRGPVQRPRNRAR